MIYPDTGSFSVYDDTSVLTPVKLKYFYWSI